MIWVWLGEDRPGAVRLGYAWCWILYQLVGVTPLLKWIIILGFFR
jgi:hypothetical protein